MPKRSGGRPQTKWVGVADKKAEGRSPDYRSPSVGRGNRRGELGPHDDMEGTGNGTRADQRTVAVCRKTKCQAAYKVILSTHTISLLGCT